MPRDDLHRIEDLVPRLEEKVDKEYEYLRNLGVERTTHDQWRGFLIEVLRSYHDLPKDALEVLVPAKVPYHGILLRALLGNAERSFISEMELSGSRRDPFVASPSYDEIRTQISQFKKRQPGDITNTAVIKPIFLRQAADWERLALEYLQDVLEASSKVATQILD